jgi:hypothetical protein
MLPRQFFAPNTCDLFVQVFKVVVDGQFLAWLDPSVAIIKNAAADDVGKCWIATVIDKLGSMPPTAPSTHLSFSQKV